MINAFLVGVGFAVGIMAAVWIWCFIDNVVDKIKNRKKGE